MMLNAVDDFKQRTLSALSFLLDKLQYVCSLLRADGTYRHKGFEEAHGTEKANKAIGLIHEELTTEASRTSIREIYRQYQLSKSIQNEPLVLTAPANADELHFDHLRLIQNSVTAIAEQENSSRRDA